MNTDLIVLILLAVLAVSVLVYDTYYLWKPDTEGWVAEDTFSSINQ